MPLFGIRPNDDDFLVSHLGNKGAYSNHASRFGLPLPSTSSTGLFKDDAQALAFRLPILDSRSGTATLFEDMILNKVVLKQKQEQQRAAKVHERHALEVERKEVDNLLPEKEQSTPGPSTHHDIWSQATSNGVHKVRIVVTCGEAFTLALVSPQLHLQIAPQLSTWDNLDRSDKSYASPFFSEAPARVWEAELSLDSERTFRAPAYAHAVILDNLMTIVRGLDSVLFAWDTEKERYVWRAELKGKVRSGLENRGRFVGISLEASHSYIQRFFFLATSMSRLDDVARSLVEPSSNPSTIAHAVSSSLSAFIDWAREEVVRLCPTQLEDPSDPSSRDGLAVVWARLADLARVVESVSTVFERQYRMVPPLAPMPRTTASLLSFLHDNLKHHLTYSLTPPLLEQRTSAWLLDHALSAWWTGWEAWVGIAESSQHESEHTWADLGIEVEITKRELSMLQVRNAGSGMEELSRTRYRASQKQGVFGGVIYLFVELICFEMLSHSFTCQEYRSSSLAMSLLSYSKLVVHCVCCVEQSQIIHSRDHRGYRMRDEESAGMLEMMRGTFSGELKIAEGWADVQFCFHNSTSFFQAVRTRVAQLRNDVRAWQVGKYAPDVLPDNAFLVKLDVHTSASSLKYPAELADLFGRFTALSVANALTAPHWSTDTGIGSFLADRMESPTFSILPPAIPNLDILLSTSLYRPLSIFGHLPSAALLTLFFTDLALTSHLDVLHSFLLFGDASFVQRFRDALFTPPEEREGSSIQRRRARDVNVWGAKDQGELGAEREAWGIGIGIRRVTDQTSWPPGGAELALALQAALVESIQERVESVDRKMEDPQTKKDNAQLNDTQVWRSVDSRLSFAYRHDEVEMDPNSLTAFNFLYLDYKAPSPLDLVIIPSVQGKYQQIFTHLLKLMRIEAVMRNLTLDITKPVVFGLSRNGRLGDKTKAERVPSLLLDVDPFDFRARKALIALCFELRTLVNSITGHAYHSAIDANVSRFKTSLQGIERALRQQLHRGKMRPTDEEEDDDPDSAGVWNLDTLELVHQQFLDRILLSLLLQKRQRPLMRVVTEGIFQVVLDLGRAVKKWKKFQASGTWPAGAEQTILEEILGMHRGLTSQASTLVKVLQALDDRGSSAKTSSTTRSSSSFKDQRGKKLLEEMEAGFEAKSAGYLSEWVFALDANRFYAGLAAV